MKSHIRLNGWEMIGHLGHLLPHELYSLAGILGVESIYDDVRERGIRKLLESQSWNIEACEDRLIAKSMQE